MKILSKKTNFIIIMILFGLIIYIITCLTPKIADDFAWGYVSKTGEPITNINQIFVSMKNFYMTQNGRIFGEFYIQLFTLLGKPIFNICNAVVYTLVIYLIYKICNPNKDINNMVYIFIHLILWFFVPHYGQVVFWFSGACNYLWLSLPILIMILCFRMHSLDINKLKDTIFNMILLFILGIVSGWSNENSSAGMIVIMFIYIIYFKKYKIQIHKWNISALIGAIIGFSFQILSPGNFSRLENTSSQIHTSIIFRFFMITYFGFMFITGLLIILNIIFVISINKNKQYKNKIISNNIIFLFGAFITTYSMMASPTMPERTWYMVVVYLTIAIGICFNSIDLKNETILCKISILISIISILCFIVMALDTCICSYKLTKQTNEREKYIISEKEKGNLDIVVEEIKFKYPFLANHHALYGLSDITQDTQYFINQGVTKYYGINSIRLK